MSTAERICAVTSHAAEYTQWFCQPDGLLPEAKINAARMLLASGRGPARAATYQYTLRTVHFGYSAQHAATSAVLLRALSFFSPGELRELRVGDPKVFDLIVHAIK
jgi:hypothetical protein